MSDAWAELEAMQSKRHSRRKRIEERKKERQDILNSSLAVGVVGSGSPVKPPSTTPAGVKSDISGVEVTASPSASCENLTSTSEATDQLVKSEAENLLAQTDGWFEDCVLQCLCDTTLQLPIDSRQIQDIVTKTPDCLVHHDQIVNVLEKFTALQLISVGEKCSDADGGILVEVVSVDRAKLLAMVTSLLPSRKRKAEESGSDDNEDPPLNEDKKSKDNDVLSLLSLASTREKENKRLGEEILELLSRPSAKEKTLAEQFRSQGGTTVQEFCPHGTKSECRRVSAKNKPCNRLHFRKIIQSHTDESLGDCSFLNTCFHMETCKYVHYEVDTDKSSVPSNSSILPSSRILTGTGVVAPEGPNLDVAKSKTVLHPPQWVHCDLRFFDMTVLGKFSVIMADPPWDIHMELPYGTLSDDEMRQLNIPALQDEGLIFLWVTGRAMELGRECLQLWGYERVDELIWVKTNQLQRIIRTGRTGHWLNHGKEHCLVGMKGNPPVNRGLDCDVIVAEVRATSHKPDEVYGIIERLSPGTRKIELFGRPHNIQPNWMTLGNQLDGAHLVEEELQARFYSRYPDGNCMVKPK